MSSVGVLNVLMLMFGLPLITLHMCGATYVQQLRRQKLCRCRSVNLGQYVMWPDISHKHFKTLLKSEDIMFD